MLRLPHEQTRKNFTSAQRFIKHDKDLILASLPGSLINSANPVADLDGMLTRLRTLKRKLSNLHDEEKSLHAASKARIDHLRELYSMPSLADVKYEQWSRVRLDRLLVDYLLRNRFPESAQELARAKGIEQLVDVDAFVTCFKVEKKLREGRVQEALAWCKEHADRLKKLDVSRPSTQTTRPGYVANLLPEPPRIRPPPATIYRAPPITSQHTHQTPRRCPARPQIPLYPPRPHLC